MTLKPAFGITLALVAACSDATPAAPAHPRRNAPMTAATLSDCKANEATLHLAPEALMTRAALTAETLAERYPATVIKRGDPRLDRLTAALRDLKVEAATVARFDPRTLVRVRCEDGRTITVLASATQPDGRAHLSVDGDVVSTTTPFRKAIDALADHH